jgi:DNA mismatch repair protein MSH6
VATSRLLKVLLPGNCLWTSLSKSEGLSYDATLEELKTLYHSTANADNAMEEEVPWDSGVPDAIRSFIDNQTAIESLGSMIWYLRQLNIDKDILSQKNFNVYDPLQRGKGLALDGQTLSHIEVLVNSEGTEEGTLLKLLGRCTTPFGEVFHFIYFPP